MANESMSQLRRRMAVEAATARLAAIEVEKQQIARAFPEIGSYDVPEVQKAPRKPVKDGRSRWTKARKAIHSARMTKMWAERNRRKAGKSEPAKKRASKKNG